MANHRAGRREASRVASSRRSGAASSRSSTAGKRKAVKPSRASRVSAADAVAPRRTQPAPRKTPAAGGRPSFPIAPSAPSLLGVAALVVAATGAVGVGQQGATEVKEASAQKLTLQANALTGQSQSISSAALTSRQKAVSRDSQREALEDAAAEELQEAAEEQARERNEALAALAASAERHASEIAANAWVLPLSGYRLTASFGESSSLWSTTHTGLDFAAPSGAPVVAVANGVVTSTGYAGAYGNQVILTLEDGTEIWYNHLSGYAVSVGTTVNGGETLGYVGSTGNSTGPHLHLEVRPGAGDPVDPYAALIARGVAL